MKKVRAFNLMEENRSWVKVWKQKEEIRCLWTNGAVAFVDMEFTHYSPGYYVYRNKTLMPITKKEAPKDLILNKLVKKATDGLRGYGKVSLPYDDTNNYLSVLYSTNGTPDLLRFKARKATVYIRFDYYLYVDRWLVSDWTVFKVRDTQSPILVYSGKELRGLIMPFKYEVERR